jgi:hypothetical protein
MDANSVKIIRYVNRKPYIHTYIPDEVCVEVKCKDDDMELTSG